MSLRLFSEKAAPKDDAAAGVKKPEKKKKGKELKVLDPKSAQNLCKWNESKMVWIVLNGMVNVSSF